MGSRAQIFASFNALKGLDEMMRAQEKIVVDPKELSYEDLEALNQLIYEIKLGDILEVTYFKDGQYLKVTGKLTKLNLETKILMIVKEKINFKDIVKIKIEDSFE